MARQRREEKEHVNVKRRSAGDSQKSGLWDGRPPGEDPFPLRPLSSSPSLLLTATCIQQETPSHLPSFNLSVWPDSS